MECLGISVCLTSGFHPKVERVNQDVGRFLWSYCQDRPGEWAAFIPWAEMALARAVGPVALQQRALTNFPLKLYRGLTLNEAVFKNVLTLIYLPI